MVDACNICAQVLNPKGEKVDSRLFSDLLHFTNNNRELTKSLYRLSMDKEISDRFDDSVERDENGEMTMDSLLKIADKLDVPTIGANTIENNLEKALPKGTFAFSEAITKLNEFNKTMPLKDKYMATLVHKNKGYQLSLVKRTAEETDALNELIANQKIQDRIIATLTTLGCSVEFLEDAGENSRFSTENADRNASVLENLIKISTRTESGRLKSKGEIQRELAEEAGHFAVASLGNRPVIQRFTNLLKDKETQKKILGDEYGEKFLGANSEREIAGYLVGRALNAGVDKTTYIGRMTQKVLDFIVKTYAKLANKTALLHKREALIIADQIARGFLSPNFNGTIEEALSRKELLFSAKYSPQAKAYTETLDQIKTIAGRLRAANSDFAEVFDAIAARVETGRTKTILEQTGELADMLALDGLTETLDLLVNVFNQDLATLLDKVDFDDTRDFRYNMVRNGATLREAHIICRGCLEILTGLNLIGSRLGSEETLRRITLIDPTNGKIITKDLVSLQEKLARFVTDLPQSYFAKLKEKEFNFFHYFLKDAYGKDYVERGQRVLFKWKNWNKRHESVIELADAKQMHLDEMLKTLDSDISVFDRFFAAMSNNGDIIGQIVDKVMKQANKNADDITNQVWDELRELEWKFKTSKGIRKNMSIFYEKDDAGNLTGNFITRLNWGKWEERYENVKRQAKEDFRKKFSGPEYANMSEFERGLLWQEYFNPISKAFHKKNSSWNDDEGRWMPSATTKNGKENYTNPEYDYLSSEEKAFLSDILRMKIDLDAYTGNAMPSHRAPQYKGTFMNRLRNRGSVINPKLYAKGIWEAIKETFCTDSEDTDYGSDLTYNDEVDDLSDSKLAFEQEKLNRLPLFGINKIKNKSQLSTDIFHSMLAYAGMATHYAAISTVVDTMEIGKNVLENRRYKHSTEANSPTDKTRAFNRYLKYLDKQVYGVSQKPIILTKDVVLNKIASFASGLASKIYLGGNVLGGLVNLGTGIIEISKEAASGEFFTLKDWKDANLLYWKSLPKNLWDTTAHDGIRDDKVNLFCRHFNILGLNRHKQKSWNTRRDWLSRFVYGECLLAPYSAGDHYMQTMSYLAMAKGKKLIDGGGNEVSLWDAYNAEYIKGNKHIGKTLVLNGTYFESVEDSDNYDFLMQLLAKLNAGNSSTNVFGPQQIVLTDKEQAYFDENKLTLQKLEDAIDVINQNVRKLPWNADRESAFMDKAREINDRLHGIYNDQDKTAFHQTIHTNMLLAMRGYALGMIQRRFGTAKYSVALGRESEGTLRTLSKVVFAAASTSTDQWGFGKALRAIFMPNKRTKEMMMKAGFSEGQYYNMRRNFGDYLMIGFLFLLYLLSMKPAENDDDDDENLEAYYKYMKEVAGYTDAQIKQLKEDDKSGKDDHILLGLAHYFALRLLREQIAYNTHVGAEDEWKNVASLTPAGVSVLLDFEDIAVNGIGAILYDYEAYDPKKFDVLKEAGYTAEEIEQLKAEEKKRIANLPGQRFFYKKSGPGYKQGESKAWRKIKRMLPYYRSYLLAKNPYEALEGYRFGRKTKK